MGRACTRGSVRFHSFQLDTLRLPLVTAVDLMDARLKAKEEVKSTVAKLVYSSDNPNVAYNKALAMSQTYPFNLLLL